MIKLEDGEYMSVMFDKEDGLTVVCEKRVGNRLLSSGGMASCLAYRDEGEALVDRICIEAMEELRGEVDEV